ncbi:MAG: hypothetical protein KAR19_12490 [Bacteroidales bacterium]|nr:hypothetical protein [Bacteroidales bacterium]
MTNRNRRIIIALIATPITIIIVAIIVYLSSKEKITNYLTICQPVEADFLLVEGWVEESVLDIAASEYKEGTYLKVITTGNPIDSYFMMSEEGLLEYRFKEPNIDLNPGDTLKICLKGTPVTNVFPEFTVFLNENVLSQHSSTVDWKDHAFTFDSAIQIISIGITFDNDGYYLKEDRNLFIKNIHINDIDYPARSKYSLFYDKGDYNKQNPYPTNFHSVASICAEKLKNRGIPEEKITILTSPNSKQNRTFASALVVNNWIESNDFFGISVNVLSEGIHSRRTYTLYQYALRENCEEIGIISTLPDNNRYLGNYIEDKDIIRELAGNLYYNLLFNKRKFKKQFKSGNN